MVQPSCICVRNALLCAAFFASCTAEQVFPIDNSSPPQALKARGTSIRAAESDEQTKSTAHPPGQPRKNKNGNQLAILDLNDRESWMKTLERLRDISDENVAQLISVAVDETTSADDRRGAIAAIGRIDSDASRQFLIDNITLYIEMYIITGGDFFEQWPCAHALVCNANWATSQAILEMMNTHKTNEELMKLATPFAAGLGRRRALAVLDHELGISENAQHTKNLTELRLYVSQE